jgi:hypothetical protein
MSKKNVQAYVRRAPRDIAGRHPEISKSAPASCQEDPWGKLALSGSRVLAANVCPVCILAAGRHRKTEVVGPQGAGVPGRSRLLAGRF